MRLLKRRPVSFRTLLSIAFLCISVPLIAALFDAGLSVGAVADYCSSSVNRVFRTSGASRLLLDQTGSLERRARQFMVLEDPRILAAYNEQSDSIREAVRDIAVASRSTRYTGLLEQFLALEARVTRSISEQAEVPVDQEELQVSFKVLHGLARDILAQANLEAQEEAENVQIRAAEALNPLIWRSVVLVLVIGLLTVRFIQVLSRPVRQIHDSITLLGSGDLSQEINVGGPLDLQKLGMRLDWLRRRLVRLEAQRARFIALVSHEIKTPLAAIREGVSLLGDGVLGALPTEQVEVVAVLRSSTERLEAQVEDLLSFTVAKARDPDAPAQNVALKPILEEVIAQQRISAVKRRIDITFDAEEATVRGDAENLHAVVNNLLANAVKFTPDHGKVRVGLRLEPHSAVIEVEDSGYGVMEDERSLIFEPFYQGKAALQRPGKGSGLGLSIVAEHVEAHGGAVEVDEGPLQGALFRVRLPLGRQQP